jgi:hypothetical protein
MCILGQRSPFSGIVMIIVGEKSHAEEKIISEIVVFIARVAAATAVAALFLLYGRQLSRKKALAFLLIVASINELFFF